PPPPASREPERPPLALVGTVAGENEGLGVFLDQTTNKVVRLKLGDGHQGWMLRKVIGREVTLQKEGQSVTLALPAPGSNRPAPSTARAPDPECSTCEALPRSSCCRHPRDVVRTKASQESDGRRWAPIDLSAGFERPVIAGSR